MSPHAIGEQISEACPTELTIDLKTEEEGNDDNAAQLKSLAKPGCLEFGRTARDFLEQLAPDRPSALARFLPARRGDVYLAVAVVLVACVIRWGIWSSHSVGATGSSTPKRGITNLLPMRIFPVRPDADSTRCGGSTRTCGGQGKSGDPGVGRSANCALLLSRSRSVRKNAKGQIHNPAGRTTGPV